MALGFSIFNISSACLSQTFVFAKLGLCIKDQWTLKHSELHKSLSKDNLQKFSEDFSNNLRNAACITFFNFLSSSMLNGFTYGKDTSLTADLMLSMCAALAATTVVLVAGIFIARHEMDKNPLENQTEFPPSPSIA